MVLGLLTIAAIPTVTGVSLGVSEQNKKNREDDSEKRLAKAWIDAFCDSRSRRAREVHGKRCVMRDNKIYLDDPDPSKAINPNIHYTQAFYIEYPDENRKPPQRGLVSTICDNPPMLNWIYADKDTLELRYGNRTQSIEHLVGPWDWTEDDEEGLTLEGTEQFVAVEEREGEWAVYYDKRDDMLRGTGLAGKRKMQISLERKVIENQNQNQNRGDG